MGYRMMDYMMGYQYSGGWSWWWMLGFMLLEVLIVVGIIIIIYKFIKRSISFTSNNNSNKAIDILNERYAKGDISEEEYNKKIKVLRS